MLCYAMLCYAVLCYAMLCYAMLCCAMLCYAMLCYAMLCCAMLCYAMLCYAMLCYVVPSTSCPLSSQRCLAFALRLRPFSFSFMFVIFRRCRSVFRCLFTLFFLSVCLSFFLLSMEVRIDNLSFFRVFFSVLLFFLTRLFSPSPPPLW